MKITRRQATFRVSSLMPGECFCYEDSEVWMVLDTGASYISDRFHGFVITVALSNGHMGHWQGSTEVTQVNIEGVEK